MYKNIITYFKIIILSIILSIYLFQTYLTLKYSGTSGELAKKINIYKKNTGYEFEKRTKFELYNDLKKDDENIVVTITPSFNLEYFNKQYLTENLFPLSGISNIKTINCNENGYYSIYLSDRYGFNNPDNEWDKNEIEYFLVGDSFTHGNCVNRPNDIGSHLRRLSSKHVLNLGYAANGPLFQYATIREYLQQNVKNVIWLYSENDLHNLERDVVSQALLKYLNDENFSQSLKTKQKKIDIYLNKLIDDIYALEGPKQLEEKIEKNSLFYKIEKFITLKNIRDLFLKKYFSTYNINEKINPLFEEILKKSKKISEKNGSNFYFVFLPSFERYGANYDSDEIEYNQIKNINEKLGIPFIDIHYDLFLKEKNKLVFFPFEVNGHYNIEGYKKVSEIIYKKTSIKH
tara:strand:- start:870 stop:2078 length:1209 start_codon:yes stop_codon:yes gene_type:complete